MANNLPYYGYYKYGVIPWFDHGIQKSLNKKTGCLVKPRHDTETLCKNSSHATTLRLN
ncbi:hypothetical protein [Rickettsia endosymbiont of Orchestes rusci]|uniref:hypothetical protein n=1 Tax=Rickettsia endosymbiont of Orchestes rusci TaxID=3066250 RepID=UPI00313C6EB0